MAAWSDGNQQCVIERGEVMRPREPAAESRRPDCRSHRSHHSFTSSAATQRFMEGRSTTFRPFAAAAESSPANSASPT